MKRTKGNIEEAKIDRAAGSERHGSFAKIDSERGRPSLSSWLKGKICSKESGSDSMLWNKANKYRAQQDVHIRVFSVKTS